MVHFIARNRLSKPDHSRFNVPAMTKLVAIAVIAACSKPPAHLDVIEDDYAAARTRALENKVPIYVEVFAPW